MWDAMLSSGTKCYHLEQMLKCGAFVIMWKQILSSGQFCALKFSKKFYVIIQCYQVKFSYFSGREPYISLKIKKRHYEHHMTETHI